MEYYIKSVVSIKLLTIMGGGGVVEDPVRADLM